MVVNDPLHPDLVEIDAMISSGFDEAERVEGVIPDQAVVVAGSWGSPGVTTFAASLSIAGSARTNMTAVDLDLLRPSLVNLVESRAADLTPVTDGTTPQSPHEERIIVDAGPISASHPLLQRAGSVFAVIEGTEEGLDRAIVWMEAWTGRVPHLVVNRTRDPQRIIPLVHRHIGLDPIMVIPDVVDPLAWITPRLHTTDAVWRSTTSGPE